MKERDKNIRLNIVETREYKNNKEPGESKVGLPEDQKEQYGL